MQPSELISVFSRNPRLKETPLNPSVSASGTQNLIGSAAMVA
jgi:hypothetical protein